MTSSGPPRRGGRPIKTPAPDELVKVNTLITPGMKTWLNSGAAASARVLSKEIEAQLQVARNLQERLGGRRLMAVFENLAAAVGSRYVDDAWLDDRQPYLEVVYAWHEALIALAPPPRITVEEMVAAGRERVARLMATTDPRYAEYLRAILTTMSRVAAFPAAAREEFRQAATAEFPHVAERPLPSPPIPPDWVAISLTHLNSAWLQARATLVAKNQREPEPLEVAAYLRDDAEMRRHGGIPEFLRTAEEIWRYREQLTAKPPEATKEAETLDSLLAWLAGPPPQLTSESVPDQAPSVSEPDPDTDSAPAVDPHVQQAIDLGRKLIAHLDPEKPLRTAASRKMLEALSRTPGFPTRISQEFKRAAAGEPAPASILPDEPEESTIAPIDAENAKVPLDDNDEGV